MAQCPSFDKPAGWAEYYKNGNFDQAVQTLLLNLIDGDPVHQQIDAAFLLVGTGEALEWRIVLPNDAASQVDWKALVHEWALTIPTEQGADADNILQKPIGLRPTGQPTFTE